MDGYLTHILINPFTHLLKFVVSISFIDMRLRLGYVIGMKNGC